MNIKYFFPPGAGCHWRGACGLMAAEMNGRPQGSLSLSADHTPSVARKLLMAGKSGLIITKAKNKQPNF